MNAFKMMGVMLCCVFLINCSNHNSVMNPYEEKLDLNSSNAKNFHSMMYFPSGTALHFPGYVVAIEKSPQELVGGPKSNHDASFIQAGTYVNSEKKGWMNTKNKIDEYQFTHPKAMFISHIIKNSVVQSPGGSGTPYFSTSHCFVYNVYAAESLVAGQNLDLAKISDWHACPISTNLGNTDANSSQFYQYGKSALTSLKNNLRQDLLSGSYTHIVVIVMGWNTAQDEAVRNFNDLTGNIMAASLEDDAALRKFTVNRSKALEPAPQTNRLFRPLIIGVTWPSYWSNNVGNVLSYTNKANDADKIGLTWLNRLINETIPESIAESGSRAKVVALGHSFGARAVTRAVFSSPVLIPDEAKFPDQKMVTSPVNLVVALQGAVSINRFSPTLSDEGAPYRDFAMLTKTKIVLTASSYDHALGSPFLFWTLPAGSIHSYQQACSGNDYKNIFNCMIASDTSANSTQPNSKFSICKYGASGCSNPFNDPVSMKRIDYIDASEGITEYNSPESGGLAHSDIYRLPMGRLLWRLIQQYAME